MYAATGDNLFFLAGQFFKSAQEETARPNGNEKVLATYDGEPITSTVVEYYKNMTILNNSTNSLKTDRDVVDYIIMNMILTDEATRLGISASDSDIEAFVSNAIRAYEIPEGKKYWMRILKEPELRWRSTLNTFGSRRPVSSHGRGSKTKLEDSIVKKTD